MANAGADGVFWQELPGVSDFSLHFEETILDLAPSCLLIVLAPVAAIYYLQQPVQVRRSPLLWIKLVSFLSHSHTAVSYQPTIMTRSQQLLWWELR